MSPIMRPCVEYGCPNLVRRGVERCDTCKVKRGAVEEAQRDRREPWRGLYGDPRWRATLRRVFARDGFSCRRRIDGRRCNRTTGLQGHHRRRPRDVYEEALRKGATEAAALAVVEAMFYDTSLIVTVCDPCHVEVTKAEREADRRRQEEARTR